MPQVLKLVLRSATAFARRHAEESIGWVIALAAATYAGIASGNWTPVAAVAVVAIAARWLLAVALRERRFRAEEGAARTRQKAALRVVAEAAGRLRRELLASEGLILRRQGLPDMNIDDVTAAIDKGTPVYSVPLGSEPFDSWSRDISDALQRFSAAASPHTPDVTTEDRAIISRIGSVGAELADAVRSVADLVRGDLEWSRKDHSRMQFPERVAEIEGTARRRYIAIGIPLRQLSELTLVLARRAYN